jgi:hypothetical protein
MDLKDGRRIAYNLEKIADCAELITQILNDNRETINFMFKSTKKILEISEKQMEEYEKLFSDKKDDDLPNTGFTVDEKYNL